MAKLAVGNWKMNGLQGDGLALVAELRARAAASPIAANLVICPPATLLIAAARALEGSAIALGGQDCHPEAAGAHTGDISAAMLKDAGCSWVILGHSERRAAHHESDALVRSKVKAARAAGLRPIVCIGETLAQREAKETLEVVGRQLALSLPEGLAAAEFAIAYEPVWAIGTGRTPTLAEVAEVHAYVRRALEERVAQPAAVPVLYGGSVKAANARALMGAANVDGALVGGASLVAAEFWEIARACAGV
jgi:triosephosphate isomerase (TIM)